MVGSQVKRTREKRGGKRGGETLNAWNRLFQITKLKGQDTRTTECKNHTLTQKTMKNS